VDLRQEPIVVETSRYRIEGTLTLPREGYRSRLSDFVNQRDRDFFALAEARITAIDHPDHVEQVPFVLVARGQIIMVTPGAEAGEQQ
jgi:hypothetical protein